ncbi:MAG TPA: cytochrome c3 family protein, partial [Phycisphaerae bacterium]
MRNLRCAQFAIRNPQSTILAALLSFPAAALAQWHVKDSPHDLSRSGPGPVKAVTETEICIFCHTPHNGAPDTPLWNRYESPRQYRIYQSSTLDARVDQPRGASKLCLSCHDGVLAVGLVRSRGETDPIYTTFPHLTKEHGGLGTDLSDDHPIGFRYDRALAAADRQLRNPDTLSERLPLGPHDTVECTTCHDPHNNRLGNFLREPEQRSAICLSCHDLTGWRLSAHANSAATVAPRLIDPREVLAFGTVRDNACNNCHKVHSAPHPERLLRFQREEDGCLNCHSGNVSAFNIASEIQKRSNHSGRRLLGVHDPAEENLVVRPHVECVDCHNPHSVRGSLGTLGIRTIATTLLPIEPEMSNVKGVSAFGSSLQKARVEYEVCLRCHADTGYGIRPTVTRQITNSNARADFRTSNASFHPVFARGRNNDVPSLIAPYSASSIINCTDCHNSDSARLFGGSGPNGPH